jgi:hypothetical protein
MKAYTILHMLMRASVQPNEKSCAFSCLFGKQRRDASTAEPCYLKLQRALTCLQEKDSIDLDPQ